MSRRIGLVLTYHSISAEPGPLCVSVEAFAAQLDWLLEAGFHPRSLGELTDDLGAGRLPDGLFFAVTFDDGYRDFLEAALPVLEQRAIPATLFVTASADREHLPGGLSRPLLSFAEIAAAAARGVEIAAHSSSHVDLRGLDDATLERELAEPPHLLEPLAGRKIDFFAYPYGAWDVRVRNAATRHYRAAFTTRLGLFRPEADPWTIPRLDAFYLRSTALRGLLRLGIPQPYLEIRHRLRRLRGSERCPDVRVEPVRPQEVA